MKAMASLFKKTFVDTAEWCTFFMKLTGILVVWAICRGLYSMGWKMTLDTAMSPWINLKGLSLKMSNDISFRASDKNMVALAVLFLLVSLILLAYIGMQTHGGKGGAKPEGGGDKKK